VSGRDLLLAGLAAVFVFAVVMAVRTWRAGPEAGSAHQNLQDLVGRRVVVVIGFGGKVNFGPALTAVVDEVNGDWLRFSWIQVPPPGFAPLIGEDGWVHRGRIISIKPESDWTS